MRPLNTIINYNIRNLLYFKKILIIMKSDISLNVIQIDISKFETQVNPVRENMRLPKTILFLNLIINIGVCSYLTYLYFLLYYLR